MKIVLFSLERAAVALFCFTLAATNLLAPSGAAFGADYCVLDHPLPFLAKTPYADLRVFILLGSDSIHKPADIEKEIAATSLVDIEQEGNLRIKIGVDTSDIVSGATVSRGADLIVLVDDDFMLDGRPKYNELLSYYRDSQITPDNIMMMDGILRTNRSSPIVVLTRSSISKRLLAHLIEIAALYTFTGQAQPELLTYTSALLADTTSDQSIADAIDFRRPTLFEGCAATH